PGWPATTCVRNTPRRPRHSMMCATPAGLRRAPGRRDRFRSRICRRRPRTSSLCAAPPEAAPDEGVPMGESTSAAGLISSAEFRRAAGPDWRVTAGGPQAVFTADSFADAARLVAPIADAAEQAGILPDVDLRPEGV